MKLTKIFYLTTISIFSVTNLVAQNEQSAILDAIAIMNAKEGINVIMLPDARGYHTLDPLNGNLGDFGRTTDLSDAEIDNSKSRGIIIQILARNAGLPPDTPEDKVLAAYDNNPFLKYEFNVPSVYPLVRNISLQVANFKTSSDSGAALNNILNNAANGVADFMIKRANEELSVGVIQKLKEFTSHYPEFDLLFPRTMALIKPVAAYDYAKTLNALKSALQEDLNNLPSSLPKLYNIPRYKELNDRIPILTMVYASAGMLDALNGKKSVNESLHQLGEFDFLEAKNNYSSFIKIVVLFSDNLRKKSISEDENGDYEYITGNEIDKITNKNISNKVKLTKFFLGLLYQRSTDISIYTTDKEKKLTEILQPLNDFDNTKLSNLFDRIINTNDQLKELSLKVQQIKKFDQDATQASGKVYTSSEKFETYSKIINTTLKLCEPFLSGSSATDLFKLEFTRISTYWSDFSTHSIDMGRALSQKEYSLAVDDLRQLLAVVEQYLKDRESDETFKNQTIASMKLKIESEERELNQKITTIDQRLLSITDFSNPALYDLKQSMELEKIKFQKRLTELEWQKKKGDKFIFTFSKVIEYYQLLAALSQAESGSEVEELLDAYALPSGSSRIKKDMDFNIALNGYVGVFSRSKSEGQGFTNEYGLTAPIGFTFSHGLAKAGSISFLAGIFDIGGVIRYKLDNEGAYQQDINLVGLISPSAQIVYGFPWYLPLSLGAGCQWITPVTAATDDINLKPYFNIFLAVDIPFFNLDAKRKRK